MLKGIIFDFDGVIAESVEVKTEAFAVLYKPYGNEIVEKVVEHNNANGGISRFEKFKLYHKLFLDTDLTDSDIERMSDKFSFLVVNKVISSPYAPGVMDFIKKASEKYKLFISTGTPTEEIKTILKGRGIQNYFINVYGSPQRKDYHIKQIMKNYNFNHEQLLFFGDSDCDLNAAKSMKVKFILRLHNFNKKYYPQYNGKTIEDFFNLEIE